MTSICGSTPPHTGGHAAPGLIPGGTLAETAARLAVTASLSEASVVLAALQRRRRLHTYGIYGTPDENRLASR
ncbi:hypothetical protein ACTXG7_05065 [Mycolicibacterium sp. Dal123E01]|uniref:hypothetical protein n=1 Tax=Mycolicibacterium sp. Dal123E01 TaxID=3457578 RepID=UPI00403ECBCA